MGLVNQIKNWFKTPFDHPQALSLYTRIVEQSRQPAFYDAPMAVEDTADGRYDLVALHAFLVMRRLKDGGPEAVALSQALHDLMFADMDQNLREMGIGDHGLPKRMKKLAEGFRGRIGAYDAGLEAADEDAQESLTAALRRNLYRKMEPTDAALAAAAAYMVREDAQLCGKPLDGFLQGDVIFGPPPVESE